MIKMQALAPVGIALMWGMVGAALLLALAQMMGLPRPAQRLATVDMAALVQATRDDALKLAAGRYVGEQAMHRAEAHIAQFGQRLDQVLAQLAKERGVVIVQRQAVAAGSLPDLTAEVSTRLTAPAIAGLPEGTHGP